MILVYTSNTYNFQKAENIGFFAPPRNFFAVIDICLADKSALRLHCSSISCHYSYLLLLLLIFLLLQCAGAKRHSACCQRKVRHVICQCGMQHREWLGALLCFVFFLALVFIFFYFFSKLLLYNAAQFLLMLRFIGPPSRHIAVLWCAQNRNFSFMCKTAIAALLRPAGDLTLQGLFAALLTLYITTFNFSLLLFWSTRS